MIHLATAADPADLNGKYFNRLKPQTPGNTRPAILRARDSGTGRPS